MTEMAGRPFRRVLVANRGEIAVRVVRACRAAGLESVAVYSEADAGAPHAWAADQAVRIGPAPAAESYLAIDRLLDAARTTGAEAVHPGYGFLAESAAFAEAVENAGLVWIGPPAGAIAAMGEKTAARRRMEEAGVPVVPGSGGPVPDVEAARAAAAEAGYPVLLKAAAGGGGKGMRVVADESGLAAALQTAASEARGAFGDPTVYLEKHLARARHVEVQVVADAHGRTIHLGERECSLQRRHQKILEEAPAPDLPAGTRASMGDVAVRAAEAVGYVGAGTVEFLLAPDGAFYFLEMNTRIQVEHPVTEAVTGIDLVGLQLAVAAGQPLPIEASAVETRGHAIECRLGAEDPAAGFLPAHGTVTRYREPGGPGIRFDSGIEAGTVVTTHYDPLLAKCIAWGRTREEARLRMRAALAETAIDGLVTNLEFQRALVDDPEVARGAVDTSWLEANASSILERMAADREADAPLAAALAARAVGDAERRALEPGDRDGRVSAWRSARPWVWLR